MKHEEKPKGGLININESLWLITVAGRLHLTNPV